MLETVFLTLPPSILWHFCTVRFPHATSVQLRQKDRQSWCEGQMSFNTTELRSHSWTGKKVLSSSDSLWKQSMSTSCKKNVISLSVFFLACNTVNTPRLIKHVRSGVHSILSHVQKHTSQAGRCQRQHGLKTLWPGSLSNSSVVVILSLSLVVEPECTAPAWGSILWAETLISSRQIDYDGM